MKNDYPYLRQRQIGQRIRIEIMADSMRVGKTTAMQVISEGFRKVGKSVWESNEDWQHNPYLQKSYEDPAKNFLESQKWFIKRKWEQIKEGSDLDVFIQDVTPEMDYCYAKTNLNLGRMSSAHFAQYQAYYHSLDWNEAPAPDLLIYLEASDNVLIQRAMDSRREFEDVDPTYFLMMKKVNREWLEGVGGANPYSVLRVNTDSFDFAHDLHAKEELVKNVRVKIDLL
jgi:deoxyguanosine kinase